MTYRPAIFVIDLTDNKPGPPVGIWLDVTTVEEMTEEIQTRLKADKWRINDSIDMPRAVHNYTLEECVEVAEMMDKWGSSLVCEVIDHERGSIAEGRELLERNYIGTFDDPADFGAWHARETALLLDSPSLVVRYFDFAAYTADLEEYHGFWSLSDGGRFAYFRRYPKATPVAHSCIS